MIKAVIFDLDDTLYPEEQYVLSGFNAVAEYVKEQFKLSNAYEDFLQLFNLDKKNVFDRFIINNNLSLETCFLHNIYIKHVPNISLYEDVMPCLTKLKQDGYKLGVITDGRLIQQKNKIQALDLEKYLDNIIITDELGIEFRKPHPKSFELMKEVFKLDYNELVYVGDNEAKDFIAPNQLGMKTIKIERKEAIYKLLVGEKALCGISSLTELKRLV